jgi:hypothetical protein
MGEGGVEVSCNCIEEAEKKLRENTGDPEAEMETVFAFTESGIKTFIPIFITYRNKKKDGSFGKPTKGKIFGAYCPICGKELKEAGK